MKPALFIIGSLVLVVIIYLTRLFTRLGKPVNANLSDSYYYHARKKVIVYSPMGNWFALGYDEINADAKTFTVLARDFGKDKQTVYWKKYPQVADATSFVVDANGTPRDNKHVYYAERKGREIEVIAGADPQTYQPFLLKDEIVTSWARDHQFVFFNRKKIDTDRKTFARLNQTLAYDSLYFYAIVKDYAAVPGSGINHSKVLRKDAKPGETPKAINEYYARLYNDIIYSSWVTEFSIIHFNSIDTIKIIDERNIVVDQVLVSDGTRLDNVDVSSFEIIDKDYFKDAKDVYYKKTVLPGANPANFKVNYNTGTATDGVLTFKDGVLAQ